MELLALAVGLGVATSLIFSEIFGLASAGLVVPGYVALFLKDPWIIGTTLVVTLATLGFVRVLSSFLIIFGRRRTAIMIISGYVLGMVARELQGQGFGSLDVVGFIIPGLLANWMERQGIIQTICAVSTTSIIVRLILIMLGTEFAS